MSLLLSLIAMTIPPNSKSTVLRQRIFRRYLSGGREIHEASVKVGGKVQALGRHPTRDAAQAAIDLYRTTGEITRTPRGPKPGFIRFSVSTRTRHTTAGLRYDVRGKDRTLGNTFSILVGIFDDPIAADLWRKRFLADGSTCPDVQRKPTSPPRRQSAAIVIQPSAPNPNPKAIQPGETRVDWMRRLYENL